MLDNTNLVSNGTTNCPINVSASSGSHIFLSLYSERLLKFMEESKKILLATIVYALFYSFCMYKNMYSVTAPLWTLGTVAYLYVCMQRLGFFADKAKERAFLGYGILMVLLGFNLFMTMDGVLIFLDHVGIMLLVVASVLHVSCDDSKWGLGKYLSEIIASGFMATFYQGFLAIVDMKEREELGFKEEKNANMKTVGYVVIGMLITLPLLIVVVMLLASADKFFESLVLKVVRLDIFKVYDIVGILMLSFFCFTTMYGLLRGACARKEVVVGEKKKANSIIGITINAMVGVVYFVFSFMQIYYLFLGNLTLSEGYTYAEYAREGFFQLVVVCAINMTLVLICLSVFEKTKGLKGILVFICGCTYIMIASSVLRMYMYVSQYNFTYTRVFVFLTLFIIFMVMNGVVVYIFNERFGLFRYAMIVVAASYIVFAYSRPCYWIAKVNLSQMYEVSSIDVRYITNHLGPDAAPAVIDAMKDRRFIAGEGRNFSDKLVDFFKYNDGCESGIRHFNLSGYTFNKIYEENNIAEKLM